MMSGLILTMKPQVTVIKFMQEVLSFMPTNAFPRFPRSVFRLGRHLHPCILIGNLYYMGLVKDHTVTSWY